MTMINEGMVDQHSVYKHSEIVYVCTVREALIWIFGLFESNLLNDFILVVEMSHVDQSRQQLEPTTWRSGPFALVRRNYHDYVAPLSTLNLFTPSKAVIDNLQLEKFLKSDPFISAPNELGQTALHLAVMWCDSVTVQRYFPNHFEFTHNNSTNL